jgi:mannose-6-phosphate isomerase-like protein (cupin superfamily)
MTTVIKRLQDIPRTTSVMPTNKGKTFYQRAFERGVDGVTGPWECVDYMTIPAGTQFGRHIHDGSEELYVILKGRGTALLDDEQYAVQPGDYLMLRNHGCHGLRNDGPEDIELLCVCIYLGADHRLVPVWDDSGAEGAAAPADAPRAVSEIELDADTGDARREDDGGPI